MFAEIAAAREVLAVKAEFARVDQFARVLRAEARVFAKIAVAPARPAVRDLPAPVVAAV
ncbi:MAG: hypothetical protein SGI86_17020 [Deltaproteobacteria bacterium]|nr:hypothetical protein [Deltaproteobacteria bacterium]